MKFAPNDAAWMADPYPAYRELRAEDPVHWSAELAHWVLTRYQDVVAVLKDARFTASNRPPQRRWGRPTMMVTADPPAHARLRRPAAHRFSASSVEERRPRIQEIVDQLVDAAEPSGRMDVVTDLARPLPRTVICELMGLPDTSGGRQSHGGQSRDEGTRLEDVVPYGAGGRGGHLATAVDMPGDRFFQNAIAKHREELADDLLNDLLEAEAGREMSPEEVLDTAVILYAAGQETTAKMISNGLYHLLTRPRELLKLREDPSLIGSATEELLRFDAPVHAISRRALEEVEVGRRTVRRGEKVLCVLAAANRDPAVFADPDELVIERDDNPHVAFGSGMHVCLGATLARAEIQIAVGTLVSRYPKLCLATEHVGWEGSFIIRGVKSLPVRLR